MKQEQMMYLVPEKLREIEKEYGVRVLFAVESGSRAWGTAAEDSDFDVRFVYIRPREDYLRLEQTRDVLEFPIEEGWDMCGWDITKLLRLLQNSNTQIYEWFASPVVYVDDGFSSRIRPLLDACFSAKTGVFHYLHQYDLKMGQAKKAEEPKVKHYLYSLQHIAAARWILEKETPVPLRFRDMMAGYPEQIQMLAREILLLKTMRHDQPFMERNADLEDWLQAERDRIQQQAGRLSAKTDRSWDSLNRFFLSELARLEA